MTGYIVNRRLSDPMQKMSESCVYTRVGLAEIKQALRLSILVSAYQFNFGLTKNISYPNYIASSESFHTCEIWHLWLDWDEIYHFINFTHLEWCYNN